MQNSSKKWYTTEVDFDLVEKRCVEYFERYCSEGPIQCATGDVSAVQPTTMDYDIKIFISVDLHTDLLRKMQSITRYSNGYQANGTNVLTSFVSSQGQFPFVSTYQHQNLLYVGTQAQLNRLVWEEIDEVFEEEILK